MTFNIKKYIYISLGEGFFFFLKLVFLFRALTRALWSFNRKIMLNFKELLRMRSTCALHITRAMSSNIEIYHSMVSFDTPQRSLSPGTARVGIVLDGLLLVNLFFYFLSPLS